MCTAPLKLIVFSILCVSLATSGADKTVTNKDLGFEITFPEAWKIEENLKGVAVHGILPKAAGSKGYASVNVAASAIKEGSVLKDFAETSMQEIKKEAKYFEISDQGEIELAGMKVYKVAFILERRQANDRFKNSTHFLIVGTHCFVISAGGFKEDFDIYTKDIDAIVKSFKLIEAKQK